MLIMVKPGRDPTLLHSFAHVGIAAQVQFFRERVGGSETFRRCVHALRKAVDPQTVIKFLQLKIRISRAVALGEVMADERAASLARINNRAAAMHEIGMPDEQIAFAREKSLGGYRARLHLAFDVLAPA